MHVMSGVFQCSSLHPRPSKKKYKRELNFRVSSVTLEHRFVTMNDVDVTTCKRLHRGSSFSFLNSKEVQLYRTVVEAAMLQLGDSDEVRVFFSCRKCLTSSHLQVLSIKDADFYGQKTGPRLPLKGSTFLYVFFHLSFCSTNIFFTDTNAHNHNHLHSQSPTTTTTMGPITARENGEGKK
jgi:hypothetical protein